MDPLVYDGSFLSSYFSSQLVGTLSRTKLAPIDNILYGIISCLPIKDVACTTLLSLR
jgi:hypothetical protein